MNKQVTLKGGDDSIVVYESSGHLRNESLERFDFSDVLIALTNEEGLFNKCSRKEKILRNNRHKVNKYKPNLPRDARKKHNKRKRMVLESHCFVSDFIHHAWHLPGYIRDIPQHVKTATKVVSIAQRIAEVVDVDPKTDQIKFNTMKTANKVVSGINFMEILNYSYNDERNLEVIITQRLEDMAHFMYSILECKNWKRLLSTIVAYFKTWLNVSVIDIIVDKIKILFHVNEMQSQSDEDDNGDFFSIFKNIFGHYKIAQGSPAFVKFIQFCSYIIGFAFFPNWMNSPATVCGMNVFKDYMLQSSHSVQSIMELICESIIFMVERVVYAFQTRDISSLFVRDLELHTKDILYSHLVSLHGDIISGNYQNIPECLPLVNDISSYLKECKLLIEFLEQLYKNEKNSVFKNVVFSKIIKLRGLMYEAQSVQNSEPVREKPFGILIHGKSAVGKTDIMNYVIAAVSEINNLDIQPQNICVLDESDEYDSAWTAESKVIVMDDYGNTKEAFLINNPPTQKIIDHINNIPKMAVKADLASKGVMRMSPCMFVVTTNLKNLGAPTWSVEPASILRRFDVVLDVTLKPEATEDDGRPKASYFPDGDSEAIADAWDINYEKVVIDRKETITSFAFKKVLTKASLKDVLIKIREESLLFYKKQKHFVQSAKRHYKLDYSKILTSQNSVINLDEFREVKLFTKKLLANDFEITSDIYGFADHAVLFEIVRLWRSQGGIMIEATVDTIWGIYHLWKYGFPCERTFDEFDEDASLEDKLTHSENQFSKGCKYTLSQAAELLKKYKMEFVYGAAGAVTVFAAMKMFKFFFNHSLMSHEISEGEIPVATVEPRVNVWKKVLYDRTIKNEKSCTATYDQLRALCEDKIHRCTINRFVDGERKVISCNGFPVKGSYWLFPSHFIPDEDFSLYLEKKPSDFLSPHIPTNLRKENVFRLRGDLCLVNILAAGPQKDMTPFLPRVEGNEMLTNFGFIYRNADLIVEDINASFLRRNDCIVTAKARFAGIMYRVDVPTKVGMCMAILLGKEKRPCIRGFHLAGQTECFTGAAQSVTSSEIDEAITKFEKLDNIFMSSHGGYEFDRYNVGVTLGQPIHWKHSVNHIESMEGIEPSLDLLAVHDKFSVKFQSRVRKSVISESVEKHLGLPRLHGPPKSVQIWKHWQRELQNIALPAFSFEPSLLYEAYENFSDKMSALVDVKCKPLHMDAVLAGVDGIGYLDRLNMNTSVGWPINKAKKNFITKSERLVPGITEPLEIDENMLSVIRKCEEKYYNGETCAMVFRATLKDEPVKFTKDKIRVFAGSEIALIILTRKYFLPMVQIIQNNWIASECAVGINAHSSQWHELATHLISKGKRTFGGDYKAFDKQVCPLVMRYAFQVLINMAIKGGYSEYDIKIMQGIASDICCPLYEYDGCFIQTFGSNPSGHPLTVIVNNIINSVYLRYAYGCKYDLKNFNKEVSPICYGDDVVVGVSDESLFNFKDVHYSLGDCGITFTMPDKSEELVEYIPFEDLSFLKRNFRFDETYQVYMAPLEIASVSKSLHNYMDNKRCDLLPEDLSANALVSACYEFFQHGHEFYKDILPRLRVIMNECNVIAELPTLGDCERRYLELPKEVDLDIVLESQNFNVLDTTNRCTNDLQACVIKVQNKNNILETLSSVSIDNIIELTNKEECEGSTRSNSPIINAADIIQLGTDVPELESQATWSSHPVTTFSDGREEVLSDISSAVDATRNMGGTKMSDLRDFFARPVLLTQITLQNIPSSINPWATYFAQPTVKNKTANYSFFTGRMHVKIVVNGSPFMVGRYLASYKPRHSVDQFENVSLISDINVMAASQRQHLWLNPTTSQGGEMLLPFIFPDDGVLLTSNTDLNEMGLLTIIPIVPAKSVQSSIFRYPRISIYAWFDDIVLSVPTAIVSQSDEYGQGIVSKPATALAKLAGTLTKTPGLGKYAMATQLGAQVVAGVASAAGYSNPTIVTPREQVVVQMGSSFSNVNIEDGSSKLSLDAKQEVTIDPAVVGSESVDQMTIPHIVGIESFLTTFSWAPTDFSNTRLFEFPVTPMLYRETTYGMETTPMCYVARAFKYWRGSLKFRMQFCSSSFHRGRVRIVFDPNLVPGGVDPPANVAQQWIVDLSETTDFSFTVSWAKNKPFLSVGEIILPPPIRPTDGAGYTNFIQNSNGMISVYVLNDLIAPSSELPSLSTIDVILSASACDDMQFFRPSSVNLDRMLLSPPVFVSQSTQPMSEGGADINMPENTESVDFVGSCDADANPLNLIFGGEYISSIRALLKRYCCHETMLLSNRQMSPTVRVTHTATIFPTYNGKGIQSNYGQFPLVEGSETVSNMTFLNYFTPLYATRRGSIRWKYLNIVGGTLGNGTSQISQTAIAFNIPNDEAAPGRIAIPVTWATTTNLDVASWCENYRTCAGVAMADLGRGQILEVEFPYQYPIRFHDARIHNFLTEPTKHKSDFRRMFTTVSPATNMDTVMGTFCAAGEDFSLAHFQGTPRLFFKNT
jgi:hypothetical protein